MNVEAIKLAEKIGIRILAMELMSRVDVETLNEAMKVAEAKIDNA